MTTTDPSHSSSLHYLTLLCVMCCGWLASCGDEEVKQSFEIPTTKPQRDSVDQDRDGWLDAVEQDIGIDPESSDAPCADELYTRRADTFEKVDVIVIIDTSGSMREELAEAYNQVQNKLIPSLARSELDAQLMMMTSTEYLKLYCPECKEPNPADLYYLDIFVSSTNSLELFTQENAPWESWLRPNALKLFVIISDDNSQMSDERFEVALRTRFPGVFFDTNTGKRRYIMHSVVGVELPYTVRTRGADITWPILDNVCGTASNSGEVYQQLSLKSGGYRYSVCDRKTPYETIFKDIITQAESIENIPCALRLPEPVQRSLTVNPERIGLQVQYPNDALPKPLNRMLFNSEFCTDHSYYVTQQNGQTVINLCAGLCEAVNAQKGTTLQIGASCQKSNCVNTPTKRACEL